MAGYNGYSMSNNAVDAYDHGAQPMSKWRKSDFVEYDEALKPFTLDFLRRHVLKYAEWHHTSSKYNRTDFYKIGEYDINDLKAAFETVKRMTHKIDKKAANKPFKVYATVAKAIWGGSSKYRKIIDHVVYQVNEDWRTKDGKKLRRSYYDVVDYEK